MSAIRDISLAPLGRKRIEWVKDFMPVLSLLERRYKNEKPFLGTRISVCVHLEAKTGISCAGFKGRRSRGGCYRFKPVVYEG